jgi:hypothetical protein
LLSIFTVNVDMRLAAYLIGVKRVADASTLRGIFP